MFHKKSEIFIYSGGKRVKNNIKICIEIKRGRILGKESIKASHEGTIPSNSPLLLSLSAIQSKTNGTVSDKSPQPQPPHNNTINR